jgi:trehalose/maltose transport system substrate-binding protein
MAKYFCTIMLIILLGQKSYGAEITIACGAVGVELDMCTQNAEAWAKKAGHKVKVFQSPQLSNDRLALFQQQLAAKSPEIDVYQIDIIWPGLLGNHFVDLNQHFEAKDTAGHFEAILNTNKDTKGQQVAIPFFTDAGLLYYRKDLLEKYKKPVPTTWQELKDTATEIVTKERKTNPRFVGYVWQGKAYEGLTCNALEWVASYGGGTIVDAQSGKVTINNPKAAEALKMAASWIEPNGYKGDQVFITPTGTLNDDEEGARGIFQSGSALFMRNWPYAWALANSGDSPVKDKVGVAVLPKGGAEGRHAATLGGWNLAVSKYSKNQKEAADLIRFMTSQQIQVGRAIAGAYNPTHKDAYKDAQLLKSNPFFGSLFDVFINAIARPSKVTGRSYNKVSYGFWNAAHAVLSGRQTPEKALADLEKQLNRLQKNGW